jgi:putative transposase
VIRETHKKNYEAYGYRRTWKALLRAGEQAPRCQVQRLMAANGIRGAKRRGKPWRTTTPDPRAARRPDLVERDFTAERPNELWVADFERHEVLCDRVEVGDLRGLPVAAGGCKLGAA